MERIFETNIALVGAGAAGRAFLERAGFLKKKIKIIFIDKNDFYFPKRKISRNPVDSKNIVKLDSSFGFDFICAKVEKVREKAEKIILDDGGKVVFKNLVIASGAVSRKLEVKGCQKEGFFYLSEINPQALKPLLKINNEISVFVNTRSGIDFSLFLNSLGKEVRVISPGLEFMGEAEEEVINILEKKKISLYLGYVLTEIIGEKGVKAVKAEKKFKNSSNQGAKPLTKVFASQLVICDSRIKPDLGFLDDQEAIFAKKSFFTSYNNVYVIGDAGESGLLNQTYYRGNCLRAKEEGGFLAEYLLKRDGN